MPLSFHEQGIYVMARHSPGYRSLGPEIATRLQGELNLGALERSLQEIVERHEILRTRYGMKNGREVRILDDSMGGTRDANGNRRSGEGRSR